MKTKKRFAALAMLLVLSMLSSIGVYAANTPEEFIDAVAAIPVEGEITELTIDDAKDAITDAEALYTGLADKTATDVVNAKATLDNIKKYVELAEKVLPAETDATKDIKIKKLTYALDSTDGKMVHTSQESESGTSVFDNLKASTLTNATTIRQEKTYTGTELPKFSIEHKAGKFGYIVPEFPDIYDNCESFVEQYQKWIDDGSVGTFAPTAPTKEYAGAMRNGWEVTRVLIDDTVEVEPNKGFVPPQGWDADAEHTFVYFVAPKNTFTVKIDKDGGSWDSVVYTEPEATLKYRSVRTNDTITNIGQNWDKYKLNGFDMVGWELDGVEKNLQFDLSVVAGRTYTIKALYAEDAYKNPDEWTATVTFDYNNGGTSGGVRTQDSTGTTALVKLMDAPLAPTGKVFDNWNTKQDGTGTKYAAGAEFVVDKATKDVTLYAQWRDAGVTPGNPDDPDNPNPPATEWTATVKYNVNGGTGSITDATSKSTAATATIKLSDGTGISKDGNKFGGWNTKADGSGTSYAAGANLEVKKDTPTVELFAQWTVNNDWTATITYFANGATGDVPKQVASASTAEQEFTLSKADNLKRDGYTFDGWNTKSDGTGTSYAAGDKLKVAKATPNVELYAKWKQVKKWTATIKYNANGGTGTIADSTSEVTDKDSIDIAVKKIDGFTYSGYIFSHWNTKSDGSGTKYDPEKKLTVKEGAPSVELFAIWTKIDPWTATIKYNANGGTGAIADATQSVQDIDSVEFTIAKGDGITKEGYLFNGWNTKADGSGTSYAADAKVTIKMADKSLELFAQWKGTTPETANGNASVKANGAPTTGSPQTSDSTDFVMPIVMMVLSLVTILFVYRKRLFNFNK